jgi:hypothetical protein
VILIRPDFRSAAIQLTSTQRFARFPRELLVARAEPFELCLFKIFEVEQGFVRTAHHANQFVEFERARRGYRGSGYFESRNVTIVVRPDGTEARAVHLAKWEGDDE